ncbi:MAG: hypothetical protein K2W95_35100 [Candidatus Obscuribacterales bacterium]|nr:hypothetical protein [Candidatus Obscuribacterales bacterium]
MNLNRIALSFVAALAAVVCIDYSNGAVAQTTGGGPQACYAQQVYVEVDGTLPADLKLIAGQEVIFVRPAMTVGADVEVNEVQLDKNLKKLFKPSFNAQAPKGMRVVAAFLVTRDGTGRFEVTHKVVAPGAKPTTQNIPVSVATPVNPPAAVPAPVVVNVDKGLPATIDLQPGQQVIFVRHKRLVGTSVEATARQTDKAPGNVLKSVANAQCDPDFYVVAAYEMLRTGYAQAEITHKVVAPRGRVTIDTIDIRVK